MKSQRRVALGTVAAVLTLACSVVWAQATSPTSNPGTAPAGNIQEGKRLFTAYGCYECHGRQAQGSTAGPRLGPRPMALSAFSKYIRQPTGQMPPYTSKVVTDSELADIHAFLQSLPEPPKAESIPLLK